MTSESPRYKKAPSLNDGAGELSYEASYSNYEAGELNYEASYSNYERGELNYEASYSNYEAGELNYEAVGNKKTAPNVFHSELFSCLEIIFQLRDLPPLTLLFIGGQFLTL